MKEKVLEIRITKISKEYSAVDIIKFNSEIEYEEEDIFLREYDNFPQYRHEDKVLYINNKDLKKPFAIRNELISSLREKVDEINKKYGIEKIGNSGVYRDKLKNDILTLQGICNVLYFDLDSLADKEMKNKLTRLKDMLEYILEAF